ncbi:MAG: hypothetical protein KDK07_26505 [Bauldia sp.]|nr:hypothetical protein [Bauldia sp.]
MALLAILWSGPVESDERSDAALRFVEAIGISGNYEPALLANYLQTTSVQIILSLCGADKGKTIVMESITAVVDRQQDGWNRRVAALFSDRFAPEEMESIATLQKQSPYLDKFAEVFRSDIQPAMAKLNGEIVSSAYLDVIEPAMERSRRECPSQ